MICESKLLQLVDTNITNHVLAKFQDSEVDSSTVKTRFLELLKFLYLSSKHPQLRGSFIPVTRSVDEYWHELILQTKSYQKLCRELPGGEFIHHESMSYESYRNSKSKDQLIDEFLQWIECYVHNFGDFRHDRIDSWFFVSQMLTVLNIELGQLNQLARKGRSITKDHKMFQIHESNIESTIIDRMSRNANQNPVGKLVKYQNEALSENDFWNSVRKKAYQIRAAYTAWYGRSLEPGECIGIASAFSLDTLSDLVAILFAGGAFVPYSVLDPQERIDSVLNDSGSATWIRDGHLNCRKTGRIFNLMNEPPASSLLGLPQVSPSQLVYIMYTSGSTGRPKGVRVSHASLWSYLKWFESLRIFDEVKTVDFSTNLVFDAALTTSLLALACRKHVVVCPQEIRQSPRHFLKYLAQNEIDLVKCTPSYFRLLNHEALSHKTPLNQKMVWLLTGEAMSGRDASLWLKQHSSHVFYNSYGPTEATVTCSKFRIDVKNIDQYSEEIPIARNHRSAIFHILDSKLQPVEPGSRGELCLEGDVLGEGYQLDPLKTENAFFVDNLGRRLYRTGDIVTEAADGTVHCHGRADDQIKVRGVRIELGEIRSTIFSHPEVLDVEVIAVSNNGGQQITAFVVLKLSQNSSSFSEDAIKQYLARKLPLVMLPEHILILEAMPYNSAGKADRLALKRLAEERKPAPVKKLIEDPVEMSLLDIWREALPGKRIGAESNFFALGGHSLLVMQTMDRINRHFDAELPIHTMFRKPTIRELAYELTANKKESFLHHLLHQPTATQVVLIHPSTGVILPYLALRAHMPAVDFYGISSCNFGKSYGHDEKLEDMAATYLRQILKLSANRPLVVGGFCTGGAVAFEMACQLERLGRKPTGLILIDSFKVKNIGSESDRNMMAKELLDRLGIESDSTVGQRIESEMTHNRRLVAKYIPNFYSGPTLLIQCKNIESDDVNRQALLEMTPKLNGWSEHLNRERLMQLQLDASHRTIMSLDQSLHDICSAVESFTKASTGSEFNR